MHNINLNSLIGTTLNFYHGFSGSGTGYTTATETRPFPGRPRPVLRNINLELGPVSESLCMVLFLTPIYFL